MSRAEREQDLITYYSNEIRARVERDLPEPRVARRTAYLNQVLGRYGVVEQWMTWDDDRVMHYQWAVLRPGAAHRRQLDSTYTSTATKRTVG